MRIPTNQFIWIYIMREQLNIRNELTSSMIMPGLHTGMYVATTIYGTPIQSTYLLLMAKWKLIACVQWCK